MCRVHLLQHSIHVAGSPRILEPHKTLNGSGPNVGNELPLTQWRILACCVGVELDLLTTEELRTHRSKNMR